MSKTSTQLENFRDLPDDELVAQLATTRDELFRLHLGQHTNQVTSTALLKTKRRDIARMMTVLNARKAGTETQAQGMKTKVPTEADTVVETPAKKSREKKAKT
jgi:large subunit ribosomal protein L29